MTIEATLASVSAAKTSFLVREADLIFRQPSVQAMTAIDVTATAAMTPWPRSEIGSAPRQSSQSSSDIANAHANKSAAASRKERVFPRFVAFAKLPASRLMSLVSRSCSAIVILLCLAGCRRVPEYHRDVAPIIAKHCVACHRRDGMVRSPSLEDYENVRRYAREIKRAVASRDMPPAGVDNTGYCGTWYGVRWLADDEVATIVAWVESGAQEGAKAPVVARSSLPVPFRRDAVLDIGGFYQPEIGPGGNQCFVTDSKLTRNTLLTAIRVSGDDLRALDQVTIFALDSPAAESEAALRDERDPRLGFACYGTPAIEGTRLVASWMAGDDVMRMPAGVGLPLNAGQKLIVQAHYNIMRSGRSYRSSLFVELELDDHASAARLITLSARGDLEPGLPIVTRTLSQPIDSRMRLLAVSPSMHARGSVLQLLREHVGRMPQCLATFGHWKFARHHTVRADVPPELDAGDILHLTCRYQTLGTMAPVRLGESIDEEECTVSLLVKDLEP